MHRRQVIDLHYQNAVNVYEEDSLFFLQSSYEQWIMTCLERLFAFQETPTIRMVDLGCGNGCFTNRFMSYIARKNTIQSCTCVDPYIEWLDVASTHRNITKILCMNANEFFKMPQQKMNYSHLLMKEMVHHMDTLSGVFSAVYQQLDDNGRVVVITRPKETNYPFFQRIHDLWKSTQIPYEDVVVHMKESGFDVSVEMITLPITLRKQEWISFIEKKTWSVFSMCSEEEMDDGLFRLQADLGDSDTITFLETLIFIVGRKHTGLFSAVGLGVS
jgi:2-polyprenyl-3-methyl-5-hydroxy-6-metoxy-1,4-benzoquinol methylase